MSFAAPNIEIGTVIEIILILWTLDSKCLSVLLSVLHSIFSPLLLLLLLLLLVFLLLLLLCFHNTFH